MEKPEILKVNLVDTDQTKTERLIRHNAKRPHDVEDFVLRQTQII